MKKEHKIELVKALSGDLEQSTGVIITNYKGLSYSQMNSIRQSIKTTGSVYRVIKNTLLLKALNAKDINLDNILVEPTACIIIYDDFAATAKLVKKFSKDAEFGKFFLIKGGYFDGMILDSATIEKIADLPSRDQLLSQAFSSLNAPITSFVSVLANIPRAFLNILKAIKDKK